MSKIIQNLEVGLEEDLKERLTWLAPGFTDYRILRQSVDARKRHSVHFVYTVEITEKGEAFRPIEFKLDRIENPKNERPLIVGSGPAGLFAAIRLVERGIKCVLFERGSPAETRIKGINKFWRHGTLDPRNNVCFGEGGAGLFSDGKLITRIKSEHIPYVMNRLVQFGAPAEIEYLSNPHVGSDKIRRVIPKIREFLIANGCEIRFDTQVKEILFEGQSVIGLRTEQGEEFRSHHVVLATGHSAEDILSHLHEAGVFMEGKSFAVGLRIEHPQKLINQMQYREHAENPKLGSANYKLTHHDTKTNIGVYSFCMCPGGYILSSGTEADGIVCNGMSNYKRNSPLANAAIVATVDHETHFKGKLFGGLDFRRDLEQKAFQAVQRAGGTKELPGQKVTDFWKGKVSALTKSSSPSGEIATPLHELLPKWMTSQIRTALEKFERTMPGFVGEQAQFFGVESRTSCPVRVTRDPITLQSVSHTGLFPCGEGAGYAGGITSAACDGIKVAERICEEISLGQLPSEPQKNFLSNH